MVSSAALTKTEINRWYRAVLAIFFASGLLTASLLARLPDVATGLNLSPGPMGALLLGMTLGSFCAVTVSGILVSKLGSRTCLVLGYLVACCGISLVGLAVHLSTVALAVVGLVMQGLGTAVSNVAANVQGVSAERALGRFVTPIMHGFFSIGTVLGAGVGSLDTKLGVPFLWHMLYFAVVILAIVLFSLTRCHSENYGQDDTQALAAVGNYRVRDAWRDKHTILIGLFVLGMALAEGSANDWVALALTDDYGTNKTVGSLGYTMFVVAMMTGRLSGTWFLNRFGRVKVLRVTCSLAILGLAIFIFSPSLPLGFVGLFIWGVGASLGFPTGMSAASDDPLKSAVRVSVVSTIGYGAFLGGPPILGLLGEHFGIRNGLLAVLIFVALSLYLTRYLEPEKGTREHGAIYTETIPTIYPHTGEITIVPEPQSSSAEAEKPKRVD
ncbi:MFS transporter [Rothia aerolata]|uniref:MFS transporter n=1 Tax=Rothia aerolata TaxID=1812262 RepID=A0A917IPW7_9MICC|nr:MFS transporter [Rothia aerolata]GGH60835.1 MFS transporter [Rothia aerolata]